jgi:hypothetical protein
MVLRSGNDIISVRSKDGSITETVGNNARIKRK